MLKNNGHKWPLDVRITAVSRRLKQWADKEHMFRKEDNSSISVTGRRTIVPSGESLAERPSGERLAEPRVLGEKRLYRWYTS